MGPVPAPQMALLMARDQLPQLAPRMVRALLPQVVTAPQLARVLPLAGEQPPQLALTPR